MLANPAKLSLALALGACVDPVDSVDIGERDQGLIGGQVAVAGDYMAAVSLTRNNSSFCTGTLVAPQTVLTAGHCVDMLSGDPNVTIYFGHDINGDGLRLGVNLSHTHPMWSGAIGASDIGLLRLNFRAEGIEPVPLSTAPLEVDTEVIRVGFGIFDGETMEADGRKRHGVTTVHTMPAGEDYFYAGDPELSTCRGDSGGPVFTDDGGGALEVVGVHSFGTESCAPPNNGSTRVELYADYIRAWIQDNDPACSADGFCARAGCVDDPDCQPCGPDGTCTADCPLPDPDCATSELGEICQADTQCTTGLCVAWRAEANSKFCSRPCEPASDDCPAGMSCQDIGELGDICYYDDDPPGIVGSECLEATDCGSYICEEGACVTRCDLSQNLLCPEGFECASRDNGGNFYCFALATEGGGCCSVSGSGAPPLGWLLLLALVIGFARPRLRR
jgi:hypothetical protein